MEPADPSKRCTPDILLVPLLTFDPVAMTRLGYGGGFYDRTIAKLRKEGKVVSIGVAMECLKYDIKLMKKDYSTEIGTLFSPILT